jgi:hypothetical protein
MGCDLVKVAHLYKITDTVTGHHYIGKHRGMAQDGYWGSGTVWKRRVKKHGTANLTYQILAISDSKYILDLERRYVTHQYLQDNPLCLNLMQGGYGPDCHTQETLDKMAAKLRGRPSWNKGIPMRDESKVKLSIAKQGTEPHNKGKPMSELTKQRVSEAKKGMPSWSKGVPKSAEQRAKISETLKGHTPWNKGVKLTEEQVEVLRQRATGRKHSEETLAKMRMRTHTEETKQKMRAAHAARKNGALK